MRLLVVGAMGGELARACQTARGLGVDVAHAASVSDALSHLRKPGADLVMFDVASGLEEFAASLKSERFVVPVIACGIERTPGVGAKAVHAGADEFLLLPADEAVIAAVIARAALDADEFVVRDPAMLRVVELVKKVAPADISVFITGETGTGKEVVARALHRMSGRAARPFIPINCAAIPEALLESELFGHEKGAFTGAIATRQGRFEDAEGGTIFLDEITEMPVALQAKLLRVLQERAVRRLGGRGETRVDVRVLAASNREPGDAVKDGSFRQDLLFRLNAINLKLPALRDRPIDIVAIAEHFAAKYAAENGIVEPRFSDEALALMKAYRWPGNVRELENMVHRAVLFARGGVVAAEDVTTPDGRRLDDEAPPEPVGMAGRPLRELERDAILATLKSVNGNQKRAESLLGISVRTIRNKLREYEREGYIEKAAAA